MKLGMSGSRNGITEAANEALTQFLNNHHILEAHHGDCVGADASFHERVEEKNIKIVIHPPNVTTMRAYCKPSTDGEIRKEIPYLTRNKNIVDSTDMLIAFPETKEEQWKSGTWSTIRYAKKTNKSIVIIYPDGITEYI